MSREPLRAEQLDALGRIAGGLVNTMQERFSPAEAIGLLSMALQIVICSSTPTRAEGHGAIDHIAGDLHVAVNTNLPADRKNDEIRVNGAGHG